MRPPSFVLAHVALTPVTTAAVAATLDMCMLLPVAPSPPAPGPLEPGSSPTLQLQQQQEPGALQQQPEEEPRMEKSQDG